MNIQQICLLRSEPWVAIVVSSTFIYIVKQHLKLPRRVTKVKDVSHTGQALRAISVALGEAEATTVVRFHSAQRSIGSGGLNLPPLPRQGEKKQSVMPEHFVEQGHRVEERHVLEAVED